MLEICKFLADTLGKLLPSLVGHLKANGNTASVRTLLPLLHLVDDLVVRATSIERAVFEATARAENKEKELVRAIKLRETEFTEQLERLTKIQELLSQLRGPLLAIDHSLAARLSTMVEIKVGLLERYVRYASLHGASAETLVIPNKAILDAETGKQVALWKDEISSYRSEREVGEGKSQIMIWDAYKSEITLSFEELRTRLRQAIIEVFGQDALVKASS